MRQGRKRLTTSQGRSTVNCLAADSGWASSSAVGVTFLIRFLAELVSAINALLTRRLSRNISFRMSNVAARHSSLAIRSSIPRRARIGRRLPIRGSWPSRRFRERRGKGGKEGKEEVADTVSDSDNSSVAVNNFSFVADWRRWNDVNKYDDKSGINR